MVQTLAIQKYGQLVWTIGVNDLMADNSLFALFVTNSLKRHIHGDWGDMDTEDKVQNDLALQNGDGRLFSAYKHPTLPKIWIITEADRSATTVLFPEDY
jgi:hypothetical protein